MCKLTRIEDLARIPACPKAYSVGSSKVLWSTWLKMPCHGCISHVKRKLQRPFSTAGTAWHKLNATNHDGAHSEQRIANTRSIGIMAVP